MIAIVGLHPNTFKPHTGQKTSVLLARKYTDDELEAVETLRQKLREKVPDHRKLLAKLVRDKGEQHLSLDDIPVEVADLLDERFPEEETPILTEQEIKALGAESDTVAQEIREAQAKFDKSKGALKKSEERKLQSIISKGEARLSEIDESIGSQSIQGQLRLVTENDELITQLEDTWISGQIAKELDYTIFTATNEKQAKDSSGKYVYRSNEDGELVLDDEGNPIVDQDCVKVLPDDPDGIAEQFLAWAKTEGMEFAQ